MTLRPFLVHMAAGILVVLVAAGLLTTPALAAKCVLASWYGAESGNRTANGERFDGTSMTAAHRSLPFGTKLRVTYKGKSVIVRVNDRGPARWTGRDLDLSRAAAAKLGMIRAGHGRVCYERIR
jgi:rare lipoprotein A